MANFLSKHLKFAKLKEQISNLFFVLTVIKNTAKVSTNSQMVIVTKVNSSKIGVKEKESITIRK
jgi:hypothetical protein